MDAILDICKDLPEASFSDGEVLLREGNRGGKLYILVEGTLVVMKGTVEVARTNKPGALFGEMSALLDKPYSATVSARGPVRAYMAEDAKAFLRSSPDVALHTAWLLAQRLFDATTYLADLKVQFQDQSDHFGMVDKILDSLMHQQRIDVIEEGGPVEEDARL